MKPNEGQDQPPKKGRKEESERERERVDDEIGGKN